MNLSVRFKSFGLDKREYKLSWTETLATSFKDVSGESTDNKQST